MPDSDQNLIYFDNAATSYPKPANVYAAHERYFRTAGNPGRGAHDLALASARQLFEARQTIAEFLGAENSGHVIFTPGCTYSINMVLRGVGLKEHDCVVVSALEHNAVMRTLHELRKLLKLKIQVVPYAERGIVGSSELTKILDDERPALCVFTEASNVTGERLCVESVAAICASRSVPLLIDAAQTAGLEANCLRYPGVKYWAASAHKGLFGSPGAGLLYLRDGDTLAPLVFGGTGSKSEQLEMPPELPDRLEPGTSAGPAIAALGAGVEFISKTGAENIARHEAALAAAFRQWCFSRDWLRVAGNSYRNNHQPSFSETVAVVSFDLERMSADRVADLLNTQFNIAVRPGLHCAFKAHQVLGSVEQGLVRVSFGFYNTLEEVEQLCRALEKIAG
jgi:cysteine desulfurase / selenocysteine lyase